MSSISNRSLQNTNPIMVHEKGFEPPTFTIKEIREAIPSHCFERNTFHSLLWVIHDLTIAFGLFFLATFIDTFSNPLIRFLLWGLYTISQGIVLTGVWVLAHECGHQAFSPSKFINNSVGWILHSALLVPYHSWRITHSNHHKATGHMTRDQVFVPKTRSQRGLPKKELDLIPNGPHKDYFNDMPIVVLFNLLAQQLFGWPLYLIMNVSGQKYTRRTNHFEPSSPIFQPHHYWQILLSDLGISITISLLVYASKIFGFLTILKFYLIPYLWVNHWLVMITYLQHTDPKLPHYREPMWTFQRGAACTIDRPFLGFIGAYFFHGIAHTHVAHHFFSMMPHYHAWEATKSIKKVLGEYYYIDNTPVFKALWKSYTQCRFVEDEGDVVFYKN